LYYFIYSSFSLKLNPFLKEKSRGIKKGKSKNKKLGLSLKKLVEKFCSNLLS